MVILQSLLLYCELKEQTNKAKIETIQSNLLNY